MQEDSAYRQALAEANETTRLWKKRYQDLVQLMGKVKVPVNEEEATAMALLGVNWLQTNAPDKLTQFHRDIQAEAARKAYVHCLNHWSSSVVPSAFAKLADNYANKVKEGKSW